MLKKIGMYYTVHYRTVFSDRTGRQIRLLLKPAAETQPWPCLYPQLVAELHTQRTQESTADCVSHILAPPVARLVTAFPAQDTKSASQAPRPDDGTQLSHAQAQPEYQYGFSHEQKCIGSVSSSLVLSLFLSDALAPWHCCRSQLSDVCGCHLLGMRAHEKQQRSRFRRLLRYQRYRATRTCSGYRYYHLLSLTGRDDKVVSRRVATRLPVSPVLQPVPSS